MREKLNSRLMVVTRWRRCHGYDEIARAHRVKCRVAIEASLRQVVAEVHDRASKSWSWDTVSLCTDVVESSLRVNESAFIMTGCRSPFEDQVKNNLHQSHRLLLIWSVFTRRKERKRGWKKASLHLCSSLRRELHASSSQFMFYFKCFSERERVLSCRLRHVKNTIRTYRLALWTVMLAQGIEDLQKCCYRTTGEAEWRMALDAKTTMASDGWLKTSAGAGKSRGPIRDAGAPGGQGCSEKKLESKTDKGLNLAQRRRRVEVAVAPGEGLTAEVNRWATPGARGRLREELRQRQREAVGLRFWKSWTSISVTRQGSSPKTCVTSRRVLGSVGREVAWLSFSTGEFGEDVEASFVVWKRHQSCGWFSRHVSDRVFLKETRSVFCHCPILRRQ